MTSRNDAYDELATRLLALADELPTPYEEDRFYSVREQNRLRSNIALVQEAAAALRAAPPTTKPSGDPVAEYLRGGCNTVPQECVSADCERTGVCQWPQPTSKEPE